MAEIIVVHGPPGSGKTTQCERLVKSPPDELQVFHVSAGDRLRGIRTGQIATAYKSEVGPPNTSLLLDHRIVNGIIFEFISECPVTSIVLVDGYPRFLEAINTFMDTIKTGRHALLGCINFDISAETSLSRLLDRGSRSGEKDLTHEFIRSRIADYHAYTSPTIKALKEVTSVVSVDAEPETDVVWGLFCRAFLQLADNK